MDFITQSIYYTSQKFISYWDIDDSSCTFDDITFFDEFVVTEDYNTNIVGFQVEGHTLNEFLSAKEGKIQ